MSDYAEGKQFRATEPLTFSILYNDHPDYPYKADWLLWSELEKRTNVKLAPTTVPASDYEQKRSLLLSAGDAPLIIPKTYPGQESAYVASGAVLPVSDYLDLMPNLQAKVKKWKLEPELDTLRQEDGKFYVLPGLHEEVWPDYTLVMRTDVLAKHNIPVPTTWQEFESVLQQLKQLYPDRIPYSDRWEAKSMLNIASATFGTAAVFGSNGGRWSSNADGLVYDEQSGKFQLAATTENYKNLVSYVRGLVEKGLMDPESFTQTDDQATQKFVTGQSFVISGNSQSVVTYRKSMEGTLGKGNYTVAKIPVPGGPAGQIMTGTRLENGIMINAKAKDDPKFVAMMQFIDWLWYSDEGELFAKWGVEGTTYTKNGDTLALTPEVTYNGLNPGGTKNLRVDYGFSGGVFAYGGTTQLLHSMMLPEEVTWQEEMAKTHTPQTPLPPYPFTDVEREQATLVITPIKDFIEQNTLKFIVGQRPLSEWDAFVQELRGKGVDNYLTTVNAAHERAKQKTGGR